VQQFPLGAALEVAVAADVAVAEMVERREEGRGEGLSLPTSP
jgi:hypothetical protein